MKGVEVTGVVDHNWAKLIYFKDPNGIQLEYCCFARNLSLDNGEIQDRLEISVRALELDDKRALASTKRGRSRSRKT